MVRTSWLQIEPKIEDILSQMTSNCDKNKTDPRGEAESVTNVLTTFWSITEQTNGDIESICFIR